MQILTFEPGMTPVPIRAGAFRLAAVGHLALAGWRTSTGQALDGKLTPHSPSSGWCVIQDLPSAGLNNWDESFEWRSVCLRHIRPIAAASVAFVLFIDVGVLNGKTARVRSGIAGPDPHTC
jgi:hypothetical protein